MNVFTLLWAIWAGFFAGVSWRATIGSEIRIGSAIAVFIFSLFAVLSTLEMG
jgi:hypothetical protein